MQSRLAAYLPSTNWIHGVSLPFVVAVLLLGIAAIVAAQVGAKLPLPLNQIAQPLFAAWVLAAGYIWRPAQALTAWLVLTLFANTWAHYVGGTVLHLDEALLPMLFCLALVRHAVPARTFRIGLPEALLGAFLLAGIASSLVNGVPPQIFGAAMVLLVKAIAVFYIVAWTPLTLDDVEQAGLVILGIATITLLLAVIEFLDPQAFRAALGLPVNQRSRGAFSISSSLFTQPGLFGWFTAFVSVFMYAYFLVFRRWWLLAAAVAFNIGTVLSGRRRPLLGVGAAFLAALAWEWRGMPSARAVARTAVPLLASLVVIVAVSWPFLGSFYASTLESYVPEGGVVQEIAFGDGQLTPRQINALRPRPALYAGSVAIAIDQFPIGAGFGRYGSHISRVFYSPLYEELGLSRVYGLRPRSPIAVTDTFWPMILGETGIIGLLAYAAFIMTLMARVWRAGQRAIVQRRRALYLGAFMAMILALVESLVAPTFVAPPVAYFTFAVAGVVVAIEATSAARGESAS
jgi:hypothetical protein